MVCPFFAFMVIMNRLFRFLFWIFRICYEFIRTAVIFSAFAIGILYLIGIRPYVVQTGSMEPAIPVNSICLVKQNFSYDSITIGDVIAFRIGENTMVTHRVVSIDKDGFTTKGDANNTEDAAKVTRENFVGKNIFHIPKAGILFFYFRTRWGKISFILTGLLLIFIGNLLYSPDLKERSKEGDIHEK